jgi:hypothetical protein
MINFEELHQNQAMYIDKIKISPLKNFVISSLAQFSTTTKLKKANKVADIVWQKFEHLGYITATAQQQFVDITIAGCLLHNLFYSEDDISTILKHRTKLAEIAKDTEIDERLLALVYEIIESQLGENHPIQKLKPTTNSPSYTFAEAVWQVNGYKARV